MLVLFCGFTGIPLYISAQAPILNSYPAATSAIYLDFDGQYVTGTSWNWGGPIDAAAATLSAGDISEIFNRVAEDFRPFNVNITTDAQVYSAAPAAKRMRVIITPTSSWYGNAGGVAFVGSFAWGDETPCWVFSTLLRNNRKWIAEAVAHEAGHTLSLHHQSTFDETCRKTSEYSPGRGEGEIGWAPIMGVGYYKNLTTWHNGPNTIGCNYIQNDMNTIASHLGLKADDHANNNNSATDISIQSTGFTMSGLINHSGDTDAFRIMIPIPTNFKLNAIPQNVGTANEGANIDIRITILDANKDTVGIYNPSTLLSAGIDTNLNSGYYYLQVKGVGNINQSDYGSVGFYSLNGQLANILPVRQFLLKGRMANGVHTLSWSYSSEEPVKELVVEQSTDGKNFNPLLTLDAAARNFSYEPASASCYYRLKASTTLTGKAYYSNVVSLIDTKNKSAVVISSMVTNQVIINSTGPGYYELYNATGKLLSKGKLINGYNYIQVHTAGKGVLYLHFNDGKSEWTARILKY